VLDIIQYTQTSGGSNDRCSKNTNSANFVYLTVGIDEIDRWGKKYSRGNNPTTLISSFGSSSRCYDIN